MTIKTKKMPSVEDFVRAVAMSLPPSDFGSHRAIQAMAEAIVVREAAAKRSHDALVGALKACAEARMPGEACRIARAALLKVDGAE
jgi:hypothetical protein